MRIQPSAVNSSLVRRGVVPVAEAERRTLARGHARAAGRGDVGVGVGIEQAHVHLGDHAARGAQAQLGRIVGRRRRQRAGLVAAVELEHRRAGALLELACPLVRHHLAAREHHAQRREVVRVDRGRVQQHHELRRDRGQHGDAVALDRGEHLLGVEPGAHDARRADDRRREVRGPQAEAERARAARSRNTSSAVKCAIRCASSWNANQRAWSCITILGSPVVPDVELRNHRSSPRRSGRCGRSPDVGGGSTREQGARAGALDEVRDLALAGAGRRSRPRRSPPSRSASIAACTPGSVGQLQRDAVAAVVRGAQASPPSATSARRTRATSSPSPDAASTNATLVGTFARVARDDRTRRSSVTAGARRGPGGGTAPTRSAT